MQVSVIIAVYNRSSILPELLDSWRNVDKETKYEYELIFSDDESSDNSVEILEACTDLPIRVLRNTHGGASKARNNAYKYASGEIIIFTGDDIFPPVDYINKHYETYLKNGENFATLGRIDWRKGIEMNHLMNHITDIGCEQFGFVAMKPYEVIDFRHFYTSNISVARSQLEKLNCLFDRSFKKYGFEDVELGYRLYKQGVQIYYNPDIVCYHDHIYDSVEKFCNRQLSAGEELNTFKLLHPEMTDDEIKIDISGYLGLFNLYLQGKYKISITCDFIRFSIFLAKKFTKILEVLIKKYNNRHIKKLCSVLYSSIFRYSMLVGLAKGSSLNTKGIERKAERFAIDYLLNYFLCGKSQIFFDEDNNFSEEKSYKVDTLSKKEIEIDYDIPVDGVKRIRFDPLDDVCKISISNAEFIFDDGTCGEINFEFINGTNKNNSKYDFSNIYDPIMISSLSEKDIKHVNIKYSIEYLKLKKVLKLLKKVMKKVLKIVRKKIEVPNKNAIIDTCKEISDKKRNIIIKVNFYEDIDMDIINGYIDICSALKNVVITYKDDIEKINLNFEESNIYNYNIKNSEYALEKAQFFNAVLCLLEFNYDFVIVSDCIEYLPKVACYNIDESSIVSDKYREFQQLNQKDANIIGKLLRIPGSKRIANSINLNDILEYNQIDDNGNIKKGIGKQIYRNCSFEVAKKNNKKPIIFVLPVFMTVGGVERNTIEVIHRLKEIYDFVVITFEHHRPEQGSLFYQIADEVLVYSDLAEITSFESYLEHLKKFNTIYNPNLIWICNSSPWVMDHCSDIRSIFNKCPIVVQDVYDYQYGWINYYDRPGIHSYDRFIAINQKIKDKFIEKYSIKEDEIDLVYSAIDISKVENVRNSRVSRSEILNKFNLDENKKYFTFIGRFTEQKQTQKIVKLAKYVVDNYPTDEIEFVMVGDGELSDETEQLIKEYNIESRVHRIKYIANTVEFLCAMDGIIITSIFEGLPIVTIEAMCVGTPILSTDVGDVSLFVNKYNIGVISKSHEMKDIEAAFDQFLENIELYKNNTIKSAEKNIEFFSSDRAARLMNDSFVKAMSKYNKKVKGERK